MTFESIFVTVGTTQFDALIAEFCTPKVYEVLKSVGCKNLTIQHGRGKLDNEKFTELMKGIHVKTYDLKSSIAKDIEQADLVISHAGAGSCIDVLTAGRPLLVIINEGLADNHQTELAEQLCSDGYLFYCTPPQLAEALTKFDPKKLKPYEKGNVKEFVKFLDKFMFGDDIEDDNDED